jgi:tyrosyl-tRNA synthetase
LVALYHVEQAAKNAEEEFDRMFVKKEMPDEIPEFVLKANGASINILSLLTETKLADSRSDARRLIAGGGVSVNGSKIDSEKVDVVLASEIILKVGKRRFLRIRKA